MLSFNCEQSAQKKKNINKKKLENDLQLKRASKVVNVFIGSRSSVHRHKKFIQIPKSNKIQFQLNFKTF